VLEERDLELDPLSIDTLQVNITRLCNQACSHCHAGSSPKRREMMKRATIDRCLGILRAHDDIGILDVTGGAPELHPDFEHLVASARALGRSVIVRHNLTVTLDPHPTTGASMRHHPHLRDHGVEVRLAAVLSERQHG
jgi:MoaA/NifB/PqqE/SkfB family radical SAM enzyme